MYSEKCGLTGTALNCLLSRTQEGKAFVLLSFGEEEERNKAMIT